MSVYFYTKCNSCPPKPGKSNGIVEMMRGLKLVIRRPTSPCPLLPSSVMWIFSGEDDWGDGTGRVGDCGRTDLLSRTHAPV